MAPASGQTHQPTPARGAKPYIKYSPSNPFVEPASRHSPESIPPIIHIPPHSTAYDTTKFPTREQYNRIESTYLTSLHSCKQAKALITLAMFDRICAVLLHPGSRDESPQFRFWVRKMFTLSDSVQPRPLCPEAGDETTIPVVLHHKRPVAIREQLYEIICHCHAKAEHGGRDKTRAVVRENYSWIPKELITQFVKACPTCMRKRRRNPNVATAPLEENTDNAEAQPKWLVKETSQPRTDLVLNSLGNRLKGSPNGSEHVAAIWPPSLEPLGPAHGTTSESFLPPNVSLSPTAGLALRATNGRSLSSSCPQTPISRFSTVAESISCPPITRQISLYRGLPNGWQYYTTYSEARRHYLEAENRARDFPGLEHYMGSNLLCTPGAPRMTSLESTSDDSTDGSLVLSPLTNKVFGDEDVRDTSRSLLFHASRTDNQVMMGGDAVTVKLERDVSPLTTSSSEAVRNQAVPHSLESPLSSIGSSSHLDWINFDPSSPNMQSAICSSGMKSHSSLSAFPLLPTGDRSRIQDTPIQKAPVSESDVSKRSFKSE